MLHHHQRISDISQVFQRRKELSVIPLVEAYAGLIQDIGNSHQPGADLGRQPDPLGLSSGEGSRRPGQRQIVKSHVDQKLYTRTDLL